VLYVLSGKCAAQTYTYTLLYFLGLANTAIYHVIFSAFVFGVVDIFVTIFTSLTCILRLEHVNNVLSASDAFYGALCAFMFTVTGDIFVVVYLLQYLLDNYTVLM